MPDRLDPLVDEQGDLGPYPVRHTLAVATTPRSGSTLLIRSLHAAGFGHGDEFWSERLLFGGQVRWGIGRPSLIGQVGQARRAIRQVPTWWFHQRMSTHDLVAYHRHLESCRTSANGVFAIKLFPNDVRRVLARQGLEATQLLSGQQHWVHLRRRERIAQAISYYRAFHTQEWVGSDDPLPFTAAEVDQDGFAQIRRFLDQFEAWDRWWIEWFDQRGIEPIEVTYEDLDDDLLDTLRRVVEPIGGSVPADLAPPLQRQGDDQNEELRQRFLDAHPDFA
jgi:LPS sulfotransferase NodH